MISAWRDELQEIAGRPWKAVSGRHMVAASLGFAWFVWILSTDADGFIFLDYINLVFHEAGHPIFGLLGPTWGLYGGTIGQLVFPVMAAGSFWTRREAVSYAVAGIWCAENLLNIGRYMADARAQVLPLVGGGEHDWTNIFSRWGVLSSDVAIAHAVATAGWMGMLGFWTWLGWRWLRSSAH